MQTSSRPRSLPSAHLWALAGVLVVLASALLLLAADGHRFFLGDTQAAYLGWEYRLGEQLRAGHWPLLDPSSWGGSNPAAEGQWGLFSPLVTGLGLVATVVPNVVVFASVVKITLLCLGCLGGFLLARSYGAAAPLAFVASVVVSQGAMTQFLDLPSWLSGLMIWSLLPWVWWSLRRTALHGASPLGPLAVGYLLVTVGYVYGTLMLIVVLVVCLLDARSSGRREPVLRVLGVGVLCGLVALAVYLPGVLTAHVTIREGGLQLRGKFDSDPLALFTSVLPTVTVPGTTRHLLPYAYTMWLLPALVWVDYGRLRKAWRPVGGLLLFTLVIGLVVSVGPAEVGPLHWPLRLQPFLVQALAVLSAVLLSCYGVRRPSRRRLAVSVGWVVLAAVAGSLRTGGGWVPNLVSMVLVAAGVGGLWWALTHRSRPRCPGRRPGRPAALGLRGAPGCFPGDALAGAEHARRGRRLPATSGHRARGRDGGGGRRGRTRVGPGHRLGAAHRVGVVPEPAPVANIYTTINYRDFHDRYCMDFDGSTCPRLLGTLFSVEPHTGLRRVDLLGISTLVIVRADFPARPDDAASGWRCPRPPRAPSPGAPAARAGAGRPSGPRPARRSRRVRVRPSALRGRPCRSRGRPGGAQHPACRVPTTPHPRRPSTATCCVDCPRPRHGDPCGSPRRPAGGGDRLVAGGRRAAGWGPLEPALRRRGRAAFAAAKPSSPNAHPVRSASAAESSGCSGARIESITLSSIPWATKAVTRSGVPPVLRSTS